MHSQYRDMDYVTKNLSHIKSTAVNIVQSSIFVCIVNITFLKSTRGIIYEMETMDFSTFSC